MKTLQALGWNWRTDGVEVCAQIDDQQYKMFVPLHAVWHEFAKEFAAVGAPFPYCVGAEQSVGGLFSSIAHAVKSVAHAVTHNPIAKAASSVTKLALKPLTLTTKLATKALSKIPVLGGALGAASNLLAGPINVAEALAAGGRIDRVAMNALKSAVKDIKTVAPYAQMVLSMVPGIGSGLSAAIGAGLALASGMSITDAVLAGVKGALPGGPIAAAAFDVASAVASGKPIAQVALNAIPISPAAKQALIQGINLTRDLAAGKNVSQTLIDTALKQLPPVAQKAVQIASALAHAKNLQQAVVGVANAAGVSQAITNGLGAAQLIQRLPAGLKAPPHLVAAVKVGLQAKQTVAQAQSLAAQGHAPAAQFLNFLSKPKISAPFVAGPSFVARFHTGPAHPHHKRSSGGIHRRHSSVGAPSPVMKTFTARFHTEGGASVSGIGARFVGAPFRRPFSFAQRPTPQLYPVRMPYQTPDRLRYAFGR